MKKIGFLLSLALLILGGVGCMFKNAKNEEMKMLEYLETKYGETFVTESFKEGSPLTPHLEDKYVKMFRPTNNKDIPFYVFHDSKEFSDNYVLSSLSTRFTEENAYGIKELTQKETAVKFAYGCANPPTQEFLNKSVSEFENDLSYKCVIDLLIAVKVGSEEKSSGDSEFLYKVYEYMKEKTERGFRVSVGYVQEDHFEDAKEFIRIAHTINFSWKMLGDAVVTSKYFEREDNIEDPSHFD